MDLARHDLERDAPESLGAAEAFRQVGDGKNREHAGCSRSGKGRVGREIRHGRRYWMPQSLWKPAL